MEENRTCETPLEELRDEALKHYREASSAIHHWRSDIPTAIEKYYQDKINKRDGKTL